MRCGGGIDEVWGSEIGEVSGGGVCEVWGGAHRSDGGEKFSKLISCFVRQEMLMNCWRIIGVISLN